MKSHKTKLLCCSDAWITLLLLFPDLPAQRKGSSILAGPFSDYSPYGFCFPSAQTGIAVGWDYSAQKSFIMRTDNAGITWYTVDHPFNGNGALTDLHFYDSLNGWTVGEFGTILYTADGGASWTKKGTGMSNSNLWSVFSLDDEHVWIGELGPNFYRTTDGFASWENYGTGIKSNPWDIYFINADTGFAVLGWCETCTGHENPDVWGYILRTTDGGVNWNIQNQDNDIWGYNQIYFLSETLGYVTGSQGSLLRTEDAGITWTDLEINTTKDLWGIEFINADTVYIAAGGWTGINGGIFRTTDGGYTWKALDLPTGDCDIYFLSFTDEQTGWAFGQGVLLKTEDAGETWVEQGWDNSGDGIADGHVDESIVSIYPNPSDGRFTIQIDNRLNQRIEVEVITIAGKVIFQNSYGNLNSAIVEAFELDDRMNGIFLVKVMLDDAVFVQRAVIR